MKKESTQTIILCLTMLVLATVACGTTPTTPDPAEEIALQQTVVALAQTQTAIAAPLTEEVPTAELPTDAPPEITEITEEPDFCYEGICFSYDAAIASSVSAVTVPAEVSADNDFPGANHPAYFEFTFNGYALGGTFHDPVLRVYPLAEYAAIDSRAASNANDLVMALNTQPPAGVSQNLPFMPFWNAAQIFTAKSAYFDFQSGSGLRYLTMYGQAFYPIDNTNLFYTYQGITSDGLYYLSAILPVSNAGLPARGEDTIDDWAAFSEFFQTYISQAVGLLEEWAPESFYPSMLLLDEMMQSVEINR